MSLKIQLLGQVRITRDGSPVDLPGYRPLALLTYLILSRRPFTRQHLVDLLFDGPNDPRAALRWTLSKLRKAVGSEYILSDQEEIGFNFKSDYWLDVFAFEDGEIELYQGDLLTGLYLRDAPRFEDWLFFEQQRLRGKYQAALEEQLADFQRQGEHAAVILTAGQLLNLDNLREDWHYALIDAYARSGRRATALEQYEKFRQIVHKELGEEPSPEVIALIKEIQAARIRADRVDPPVPLRQVGAPVVTAYTGSNASRKVLFRRISWIILGILSLSVVAIFLSRGSNQAGSPVVANAGEDVVSPELAGKTILIMGSFFDHSADLFVKSMAPFEARTGIDIVFIPAVDVDIARAIDSGHAPDIAIFPQPGRLAEYARQGKLTDLRTFLSDDYLNQQYLKSFLSLATLDDQVIGAWYSVGLKSLVWYPKQAFEAKGYEVPETWDELIALSDRIVADGGVPWCIGVGDYDALGWVGTDWVEDILLRTASPETYDAWVRHDLLFDSPEIRRVFEIMGQIWLHEDYVYGGTATILKENFSDSPAHLFEQPPGCYLHRQASWAPLFFPPGLKYDQDYDFFYLPPIDPEFGKPVLGGGDIFAMFNDRPEVREVVRYLTTPESAKALIQQGGILSPYKNTPLDWFPTAADLRFAQIVLSADTYRFDGSDLMPEAVGFGSFFRGITDWVGGADLTSVLQQIDDSWPR